MISYLNCVANSVLKWLKHRQQFQKISTKNNNNTNNNNEIYKNFKKAGDFLTILDALEEAGQPQNEQLQLKQLQHLSPCSDNNEYAMR